MTSGLQFCTYEVNCDKYNYAKVALKSSHSCLLLNLVISAVLPH